MKITSEINENIALKESISPSSIRINVRLFSKRSLMTSKCCKNEKRAKEVQPNVSLMFLIFYFLRNSFSALFSQVLYSVLSVNQSQKISFSQSLRFVLIALEG